MSIVIINVIIIIIMNIIILIMNIIVIIITKMDRVKDKTRW